LPAGGYLVHSGGVPMRRLENEDEEKFWEAWIKDDLIFVYRYGKIGSPGHTKLKKLKTRAEAEAELEARVAEKLAEGFADPNAEEAAEDAAEGEDEESAQSEPDDAADEDDGGEDDAGEDAGDSDEDADEALEGADDEDDEEADEDEEDEEDEEAEEEDEEAEEEDEKEPPAPRAGRRATAPAVVDAPPPKPSLPARVRPSTPTPERLEAAIQALDALRAAAAAGARSWKLARLARRARHALERLGGTPIAEHAGLEQALDAATSLVLAPTKRLPLEDALTVLWVVDVATYARVVARWRAKMLDAPVTPAIGVLSAVFEHVPDPEVAVHVGAALVNRRLPPDAFQHWLSRIKPFLAASIATTSGGWDAFRAALKPGKDALLRARVAEVGP